MAYIDPDISLKELIRTQKKMYKSFVPMHCYALRKEVTFNAKGFEHLHMDGRGHRRGEKDARARLLLLEHAPVVISQSKFSKTDIKTPQETYSGKQEIYHELYCKVGVNSVLVVVTLRTVGSGNIHFYGIRYR